MSYILSDTIRIQFFLIFLFTAAYKNHMKKNFVISLVAFALFTVQSVVSASEFVIHKSFEFLAVDGKDLDPGPLAWNSEKSVELSAGLHRIAIQFYEAVPSCA